MLVRRSSAAKQWKFLQAFEVHTMITVNQSRFVRRSRETYCELIYSPFLRQTGLDHQKDLYEDEERLWFELGAIPNLVSIEQFDELAEARGIERYSALRDPFKSVAGDSVIIASSVEGRRLE